MASVVSIGSADCLIECAREDKSCSALSINICRSATLSVIGCTFCGPSGPVNSMKKDKKKLSDLLEYLDDILYFLW